RARTRARRGLEVHRGDRTAAGARDGRGARRGLRRAGRVGQLDAARDDVGQPVVVLDGHGHGVAATARIDVRGARAGLVGAAVAEGDVNLGDRAVGIVRARRVDA